MSAEPSTRSASVAEQFGATERERDAASRLFAELGPDGIRRIVDMRAEGKSNAEIAAALNASESASKGGSDVAHTPSLPETLDAVHAFLEGDGALPKAVLWAQLIEDYNCHPKEAAELAGIALDPDALIQLVIVRNYIEDFHRFAEWEEWGCLSDDERAKKVEKYKAHGPEGRFIPEVRRRRKEKIAREIAERDATLKEGAA